MTPPTLWVVLGTREEAARWALRHDANVETRAERIPRAYLQVIHTPRDLVALRGYCSPMVVIEAPSNAISLDGASIAAAVRDVATRCATAGHLVTWHCLNDAGDLLDVAEEVRADG